MVIRGNNPNQSLKQFQKLNPPAFEGKVDPLLAEKWLRQIGKISSVMDCTEDQNISFASFKFQGEAEYWWEIIRDSA